MPRRLLVIAALLVTFGLTARGGDAARVASCAPSTEVKVHDEAVFGHFATLGEARALKRRLAAISFKGIAIETEDCGDYEVEADGADTSQQRGSFATEARRAGYQVTFEQTGAPMAFQDGVVVGIFARKTTVAAANALMQKLATINFRYIDLVRQGKRWLVVMPQVPTKSALPIAHEVASAGYRIQFQPGVKP